MNILAFERLAEGVASVIRHNGILFSFHLFWVPPKCKTSNIWVASPLGQSAQGSRHVSAPLPRSYCQRQRCSLHNFNWMASQSICDGAATTLRDCPRMNSRAYCPLIDGTVSLSDSCPLWPTKNSSQSTDRLASFSSFPLIDLID